MTRSLQDVAQRSEKISEMTAVMCRAANMEDRTDGAGDVIDRLQQENHMMRELLQLELLHSTDGPPGADTQKAPSSDVAVQTPSSPDDDPFCTGDFSTIRPRPPSSRNPPSTEVCTAGENALRSPYQQNPDSEDPTAKLSPSSAPLENSADISSDRLDSSNDVCSALPVSSADSTPSADLVGNVKSSESLETLLNESELSEDSECQ